MIHLKQHIRNIQGTLSPAGLYFTFAMPSVYVLKDLQEYHDRRREMQKTPWYVLLNPGRQLKEKILVILPACHYRSTGKPEVEELRTKAVHDVEQIERTLSWKSSHKYDYNDAI